MRLRDVIRYIDGVCLGRAGQIPLCVQSRDVFVKRRHELDGMHFYITRCPDTIPVLCEPDLRCVSY